MPFIFLNSELLAGAAAAVIPLIVHLVHRRRPRSDLLGTLKFLQKSLRAARRRMRLRHLLVLLLRIGAVLAVVATLSRPAWQGALFFRAGSAPVTAVVVLDNSPSMAYSRGGVSRINEARRIACMAVGSLPPGSKAALVVTGLGPRGEALDREFTFNTNSLCAEIARVEISAFGGTCSEGVSRAWALLEEETSADEGFGGNEVYVLSDLAENAWPALSLPAPPEKTRTFIVDVGGGENENFRVTHAAGSWRGAPDPHVELEAAFEGADLAAARLVEVHLAGAKRAERILEVPAGASVKSAFDVSLLQPSDAPLQGWVALADADPLRVDNSFYLTVPPRREIRCTILTDSPGARTPAFFVANALEPPALEGRTAVSLSVIGPDELDGEDLSQTDCLVLAGLAGLSGAGWHEVQRFLENGGGVLLFLGGECRPASYNPFLRRNFGVELGELRRAQEGPGSGFSVVSFDHPALAAFAGGRNGRLTAARFRAWRALRREAGGPGAVELARFAGGGPALLAAAAGEGRAVAAAFSPVPSETDLVLRACFVPFVNEMAAWASRAAAAAGQRPNSHFVGETVRLEGEGGAAPLYARVTTPLDDDPVEVSAAGKSDRLVWRAWFPGNYTARLHTAAGESVVGFSVNLPPAETSGRRADPEALESALGGAVVVRELADRRVAEARGATRGAREIFDFFLVAALALLAGEAYLANRFHREGGVG